MTVERIGVVALIVILFDGGMDIGWRRSRVAPVPILSLGVLGTFASAGLIAVARTSLLDLSWTTSGLLGAALAPTDPAVTFSVLGDREIGGRTGTILEGESGANDPVGIALMIGMIELATSDDGSLLDGRGGVRGRDGVGAVVGVGGRGALVPLMRRASLPSGALPAPRARRGRSDLRGGDRLHGSGFLAVFVAGLLIGDRACAHQTEIEGFLSSLASLAEIACSSPSG